MSLARQFGDKSGEKADDDNYVAPTQRMSQVGLPFIIKFDVAYKNRSQVCSTLNAAQSGSLMSCLSFRAKAAVVMVEQ